MKHEKLPVKDADGVVRWVDTICSNAEHIGNAIAENRLGEDSRLCEVTRLYEGQLSAMQAELVQTREELRAANSKLASLGALDG